MGEFDVLQGVLAGLIEDNPFVGRGLLDHLATVYRRAVRTARDRLRLVFLLLLECLLEHLVWLALHRLAGWKLLNLLGVGVLARVGEGLLGLSRRDNWPVVVVDRCVLL